MEYNSSKNKKEKRWYLDETVIWAHSCALWPIGGLVVVMVVWRGEVAVIATRRRKERRKKIYTTRSTKPVVLFHQRVVLKHS